MRARERINATRSANKTNGRTKAMARRINSRLKIKGILTAQTPLHVGGYGESFETDMALAKNGNDEFYIPGTSLTGALRSWFENAFGKDNTIEFWGFQEDEKER